MLWGIKDWWIRERQKGFLEETVTRRPDCKEGASCSRQKDLGEWIIVWRNMFKVHSTPVTAHARECKFQIAPYLFSVLVLMFLAHR